MEADQGEALPEIEALIRDRGLFNEFVYTPLEDALTILRERWEDPAIPTPDFIPPVLASGFKAVIFRQLVTPNYEIRRFVNLIDSLDLDPVFWEYHSDKFTSNNEWKHSLGKMFFYKGHGKKGGMKVDSLNVIDFNRFNGKRLSEVETTWGESLVDFHHDLIEQTFRKVPGEFFDASAWFAQRGGSAKDYYASFLSLFIKHGILFENFMLDEKETEFTEQIFLPAFMSVYRETGLKPLIVSLEPTDIEGDLFWMCHPHESRAYVDSRSTSSIKQ